MRENVNLKKITPQLVSHHTNPVDNLRENLLLYIGKPEVTLKYLSDAADIPIDTLKSLLYGKVNDCKISTVEKLACALGITIAELVGSKAVDQVTLRNIAVCRLLPEHQLYLVRWFIQRQALLAEENQARGAKVISVLKPQIYKENLKMTNVMEPLCIDSLPSDVKSCVFMGLELANDHYMPYFSPYDILLLAADRPGHDGEIGVIVYYGNIFIVRKRIYEKRGQRQIEYVGLINPNFRIKEAEVETKIGYLAWVCHPGELPCTLPAS